MTEPPLCIIEVNTFDQWGGAEVVALDLHRCFIKHGHHSYLVVGRKTGSNDVLLVPNNEGRGRWYRFWRDVENRLVTIASRGHTGKRLREMAGGLADPKKILDERRGVEVFRYPGTYRILDLSAERPDILHLHNLHGGYFDLQALPWLSRQIPCILTLHDSWLVSGHCGYTFDCNRWKLGCGHCPDLMIYPPVRRDATAFNWQRKQGIYAQSRLHIATPSTWLMRIVNQSILLPSIVDARVIPYGIDLSIFQPANRQDVRSELQLPHNASILLFVASGVRQNSFKDYPTIRAAVIKVAEQIHNRNVLLLAVGESAKPEMAGKGSIHFVPFEQNPRKMAKYYQAADLYLHAARADNFPVAILEALACGTPVVATGVGGIPEQIKSLGLSAAVAQQTEDRSTATGVLVAAGDANGMASSVITLLRQDSLRHQMSGNAARDAQLRFSLEGECNAYLNWYRAILNRRNSEDAG